MHSKNLRSRSRQKLFDDGARANDLLHPRKVVAIAQRSNREQSQVVGLSNRARHAAHGRAKDCS